MEMIGAKAWEEAVQRRDTAFDGDELLVAVPCHRVIRQDGRSMLGAAKPNRPAMYQKA